MIYKILDKDIEFTNCNSLSDIANDIYTNPSKYFTTINNDNKLCCRKCKKGKTYTSIYNKIRYHRDMDDNWYCKECANSIYKSEELKAKNKLFSYQSSCKYGSVKSQYEKYKVSELTYYVGHFSNSDYIKFGVTSNLNGRKQIADSLNEYELLDLEPLVTGSTLDIIDLEYDIKLNYALRNADDTVMDELPSATETFSIDDLDKIKTYIKNNYKNLNILF